MNDFELRFRCSSGGRLWHRMAVALAGIALCLAGKAATLRADDLPFDPIPTGAANSRAPIWVSPISPYDPAEGTADAHAVRISTNVDGGYVQTSAFRQSTSDAASEEQLPPGGYLWGGTPSAPAPSSSTPSVSFPSTAFTDGATPPPESVDPPAAGNLMGGLGFGSGAPIGIPPMGPLMSDQPIIALPDLPAQAIHAVLRVHQSITDEVGDDGPITSIGGFIPHTTANGLWFFDGQFNLLEDAENPGEQTLNFGANLGLGWRWIVPSWDSVAGLSFWYDLDRTRPDFVHQAGVSGELLGDLWQGRINAYFPCGTNRLSSYSALGPAYYVGENIDFGQTRYDNVDMGGFDFELGRRLPGWLGRNGVFGYLGGYYYRADEAFETFGAAARLQALISPNLTIEAKFTNDHIFKNRVGIDVTWLLPWNKCKSCADTCCSEVYRLTEPVERNRTVVFATQAINNPVVALNPATGTPIVVVHVDSNAPAGGNGTINDPYNNLPAAQAGSAPNDIILVDAGSQFSGQGIALQASQRFLGEGIPHTVATVQEGTITLPTVTGGTVLPVISNSPTDTVTLASNNEVSGFTINNSGGEAIAGNGIAGTTNINNVAINGGQSGINIQNSTTTATITNVPITGAATGISLSNDTGSFHFVGTQTVNGSTTNGVVLSGNSAPVTFDNLQVNATTGTGLSATNQTGTLTISAGSVSAAAGTGVSINNSATTAAPLAVTLTSVNSAGGTNGILLNNAGGSFTVTGSGTTAGSGGTISNSTAAGVSITGESGTVSLNNMIVDPSADGVDVASSTSTANVSLTNAQVTATGATGVNVTNNAGAFSLNSSTVTDGSVGVNISGTTSTGTNTLAGLTVNNSTTGIQIQSNTGTTNATGTTTVTGSTTDGVRVDNNSGAVSFNNLQVTATSGTGLESTGQTGTFTITGGSVTNNNGAGVVINGTGATGTPLAITLASVNTTGGPAGIQLQNDGGNFTVTGSGTTAGSGGTIASPTNNGVQIGNESGTVSLNNMNVNNAANNGVVIQNSNATGAVTLNGMSISSPAGIGVLAENNIGTTNINTTTVTGGNAGVQIQNNQGATNSNTLTVTNAKTGIVVQNNSGTTNATTFTGTTTVTGSTTNGVQVDDNQQAVSFNNLQVSANSGIALESNDQQGAFTITGGNIANANGTAVRINGTGATGTPLAITLGSVSSTGDTVGIDIENAGGSFSVTGTGTTAGSGGTITGTASDGIAILNEFGTVSLSNMNVTNAGRNGVNDVAAQAGSTVTLTNLDVTNAATAGINIQNSAGTTNVNNTTLSGSGSVGLDANNNPGTTNVANLSVSGSPIGIDVLNNTGAVAFTGTTSVSGSTVNGVAANANSGPISFATLNISATTGVGLSVSNQTGAFTVTGGTVTASADTAVNISNAANLNVTFGSVSSTIATGGDSGIVLSNVGGTFTVNGGTINVSGSTGNAVDISNSSGITINGLSLTGGSGNTVAISSSSGITIENSTTLTSTAAATDQINATSSSGTMTFTGNIITLPNSFDVGIYTSQSGSNSATFNISNNSISGGAANSDGIAVSDTSTANSAYQINGNSISLTGPAPPIIGIELDKTGGGTSTLDGTVNNAVSVPNGVGGSATESGGGSWTGTIIVNNNPFP